MWVNRLAGAREAAGLGVLCLHRPNSGGTRQLPRVLRELERRSWCCLSGSPHSLPSLGQWHLPGLDSPRCLSLCIPLGQACLPQPFLSQGEPKLSGQMKAVSAECLGPPLDISTKNITKSLASLVEIKEDGVGFSIRDPYYRDEVSRTISLPTKGSTL